MEIQYLITSDTKGKFTGLLGYIRGIAFTFLLSTVLYIVVVNIKITTPA